MPTAKAETYTMAQVKEFIKATEDTIMNMVNSHVDRLERKIQSLTEENILIKKELKDVTESMQYHSNIVEDKLKEVETKSVKNDNEELLEKLAELEDRNRRNNLRFSGLLEEEGETWEETENKVQSLVREELGIRCPVKIERAHRSGRVEYNGERNWKRTIVVKFLDFKEKKLVLDAFIRNQLWERKIYINEDFSSRTVLKRKELFAKVKELRAKGSKVKVVYNKLVFSGTGQEVDSLNE